MVACRKFKDVEPAAHLSHRSAVQDESCKMSLLGSAPFHLTKRAYLSE